MLANLFSQFTPLWPVPKASRAPSRFSHWASCALATAFCINTSFYFLQFVHLTAYCSLIIPQFFPLPYRYDLWLVHACFIHFVIKDFCNMHNLNLFPSRLNLPPIFIRQPISALIKISAPVSITSFIFPSPFVQK